MRSVVLGLGFAIAPALVQAQPSAQVPVIPTTQQLSAMLGLNSAAQQPASAFDPANAATNAANAAIGTVGNYTFGGLKLNASPTPAQVAAAIGAIAQAADGSISAQMSGPQNGFARQQANRAGDYAWMMDYVPPGASLGTTVGTALGNPTLAQLASYHVPGSTVTPFSPLLDPIAGYAPVGVLSGPTASGGASLQLVSPNSTGGIPSWSALMMESDDPATRWMHILPGMTVANLQGSPINCIAAGSTVSAVPQVTVRQFELFPSINGVAAAVDYVFGMPTTQGMIAEANGGLWQLTTVGSPATTAAADLTYTPGLTGTGPTLSASTVLPSGVTRPNLLSVGGPRYGAATDVNGLDPGPWNTSYIGTTWTDANGNVWTLRQRAEFEPLRIGTAALSAGAAAACPGATAKVSIINNQLTIQSITPGGTIAVGSWVYGNGIALPNSVQGITATTITGLVSGTANTAGAVYSINKNLGTNNGGPVFNNTTMVIGAPIQFAISQAQLDNLTVDTVAASAAAMWAVHAPNGGDVELPAANITWNWPVMNPANSSNFNQIKPVNFEGQGYASRVSIPADAGGGMNGLACAITEANVASQSVTTGASYKHFHMFYDGNLVGVNGAAGPREYALCLGETAQVEDFSQQGLFAIGATSDHIKMKNVNSSGTYGFYFMPYSVSIGNLGCVQCGFGSNLIAGVGVSSTNGFDSAVFNDVDIGYQPIGIYAGPPAMPNIQNAGGGGFSNFTDYPASTESIGLKWMWAPTLGISYINLKDGGTPNLGNPSSMINDGQHCNTAQGQNGANGSAGGCDVWAPNHVIDASSIGNLHITGANWGPDYSVLNVDPTITGAYAGIKSLIWSPGNCNDIEVDNDPGFIGSIGANELPIACAGNSVTNIRARASNYDVSFFSTFVPYSNGHNTIYQGSPVGRQQEGTLVSEYMEGLQYAGVAAASATASGQLIPVYTWGTNIPIPATPSMNGVAKNQGLFPTAFSGLTGPTLNGVSGSNTLESGFAPVLDFSDAIAIFDFNYNGNNYIDLDANARGGASMPQTNLTAGSQNAPFQIGQLYQQSTYNEFTGPSAGGYVTLALTPIGKKQQVCNAIATNAASTTNNGVTTVTPATNYLTVYNYGTTTVAGTVQPAVNGTPTCHEFIRVDQTHYQ